MAVLISRFTPTIDVGRYQSLIRDVIVRLVLVYTHSNFFLSNFPSYTEKYTLCPLKIFYIFENFMLNSNKEGTIFRGKGNIYIITNQNRELYSVRPHDLEHGDLAHGHLKTASQVGAA